MKKNLPLISASIPLFFAGWTTEAQNTGQMPNIIVILADDLGIGDLGCFGQQMIKTPNIDFMYRNGKVMANHYAGSTVSAPSRCCLLTGKHTGHSWIRGNRGVEYPDRLMFDEALADRETTVAELFKQKDYTTACIGKWGLGGPGSEGHPNNQGFNYFFGHLGQGHAHRYYPEFIWENGERIDLGKKVYSHDLFMDKALEFIDKNSDKPFFLYLTPTIPHVDLDVPELGEYDGMFEEIPYVNKAQKGFMSQPKPRATYAAMVSRLDRGIGEVLEMLKKKGINKNTLVIFASDNGPETVGGSDPEFFDSNSYFRGIKRDLYEGGIRVPFIAYWPETIDPGTYSCHISTFWDFLPTVCDLIGVEKPVGIDGISYLPSLLDTQEKQKEHDYLYFEFHERNGKRAVIKDGWKLVELNVNVPEKRGLELYNLAKDPCERYDMASKEPKIVKKLKTIMDRSRTDSPFWNFKEE